MNLQQALNDIAIATPEPPREAVEFLLTHRDEALPALMEIAANPLAHFENIPEAARLDTRYVGHLFALVLLAEWGETRAWPTFHKALAAAGKAGWLEFEDQEILDLLPRLLPHIVAGLGPLEELAADVKVELYCRMAAFDAMRLLWQESKVTLIALRDCLDRLHPKLMGSEESLWDAWAALVIDLRLVEFLPRLEQAFEDGWISSWQYEDVEDIRSRITSPEDSEGLPGFPVFKGALEELEAFNWFSDLPNPLDDLEFADTENPSAFYPESTEPYRRESPKVGRNDPCPCGSGKKYKKCHGGES